MLHPPIRLPKVATYVLARKQMYSNSSTHGMNASSPILNPQPGPGPAQDAAELHSLASLSFLGATQPSGTAKRHVNITENTRQQEAEKKPLRQPPGVGFRWLLFWLFIPCVRVMLRSPWRPPTPVQLQVQVFSTHSGQRRYIHKGKVGFLCVGIIIRFLFLKRCYYYIFGR
jgi:hypothetical protein